MGDLCFSDRRVCSCIVENRLEKKLWSSKISDKKSADKLFRQTKVLKIRLRAENIDPRKISSTENFVHRNSVR